MNEIVILKGRADATQLGAHAPYKHVPRHPVAQFFILETRNEWKTYHNFCLNGESLPRRTVGPMTMKSTRRVLGHSLLRSLVRSHRSLIRLLRTARFARALRCAHSFARSLTHSLQSSWESGFCLRTGCVDFISFEPTVRRSRPKPQRGTTRSVPRPQPPRSSIFLHVMTWND